jgi:hypothetical protein
MLNAGPRDEEQLSAPEVKFVRKKVKRKSNSPLGVIADFITQVYVCTCIQRPRPIYETDI